MFPVLCVVSKETAIFWVLIKVPHRIFQFSSASCNIMLFFSIVLSAPVHGCWILLYCVAFNAHRNHRWVYAYYTSQRLQHKYWIHPLLDSPGLNLWEVTASIQLTRWAHRWGLDSFAGISTRVAHRGKCQNERILIFLIKNNDLQLLIPGRYNRTWQTYATTEIFYFRRAG